MAEIEGAEQIDEVLLAEMLSNLGNAYGCSGDANRKRELRERALAILERHCGPDHPEVHVQEAKSSIGKSNELEKISTLPKI